MKQVINKMKEKGFEHIFFIAVTIFSAGIHFLFSIYVKAYVEPLEYGMYLTCMILQTYLLYLQLGTLNAFNRDYPQLVGARDSQGGSEYRNTIFSFLIIIYFFAVVVIIIICLIVKESLVIDNRIIGGFIFMAIITASTIIENYGNYRCRIDRGFMYSSLVILLELLGLMVGVILIPRIGYYAIYITSILEMGIGIICYYKPSFSDFKFTFNFLLFRKILFSGAPLLVNGLIWTVVNSIDKFVILGFMNTQMLGMYGIAQNAFSYIILIPSAMSQLFYVNMGKTYGLTGSKEILIEKSLRYANILADITIFIALIGLFFLPSLVEIFMPSYRNGVLSAQILILGLSIYAATLINGNILTILKCNRELLIDSTFMCIFNVIFSVGLVHNVGEVIENVAWGTAISYIFYAFLIIYHVCKRGGCNFFELLNVSVVPVVICLLPGFFIYRIIGNKIIGFLLSLIYLCLINLFRYKKNMEKY